MVNVEAGKRDNNHQNKKDEILVKALYRDVSPSLIIIHPVVFTLVKRVIQTRMLFSYNRAHLSLL